MLKEIELPFKAAWSILALGAHTKNTVCFVRSMRASFSRVHADLNNPQDFLAFRRTAGHLLKNKPRVIAHDLHPEYQSTKLAQQILTDPVCANYGFIMSPVQHHHAHIAACMAENGLPEQRVIGVAFDGTGLGSDNSLWGSEFFVCGYGEFKRAAHLKEIPLLGGEKAITEAWRLAWAWLYSIYNDKFLDSDISWARKIDRRAHQVLKKMYLGMFNAVPTSSMGRLFDAAGCMILGRHNAKFEAELAIQLERAAEGSKLKAQSYGFHIRKENGTHVIDPADIFKEITEGLKTGEPREDMAYKFHYTVAQMIKKTCLILRKEHKIDKVVLAGGVFQNRVLLRLADDLLTRAGFQVFAHCRLPCTDASISLGQAMVAGFSRSQICA